MNTFVYGLIFVSNHVLRDLETICRSRILRSGAVLANGVKEVLNYSSLPLFYSDDALNAGEGRMAQANVLLMQIMILRPCGCLATF